MTIRKKELRRKPFFEAVLEGKMTLVECQEKLKISYRQVKRSFKRYCTEGDEGLCHKSRGKKPCNTYPERHKSKVLAAYREKYIGFGPLLASEKMQKDDGIIVNDETLRLWLKKAGLWTRKRKHVVYRERRERRSQFGDLLQIDGSIHDWFSIGKHDCLLNMVDDATGTTFALLDTGETTLILLTCLKRWIEKYGIPKSVYVDLKSVYVGTKQLKNKNADSDEIEGFSVFQQVCNALSITIVKAYSPQAKGRVERKHQIFQDRFLKDLKLYGIKTIEEANQYLENEFLSFINLKFSVIPKDAENAHRNAAIYGDLDEIICWKIKRQVRNDWTIRYRNEYFQLREPNKDIIKPGKYITLKKYLNGEIRFWVNNIHIKHGVFSRKPEAPSKTKKYYIPKEPMDLVQRNHILKKNSQNSPWRQSNSALYNRKSFANTQDKSSS
jgi:transposase